MLLSSCVLTGTCVDYECGHDAEAEAECLFVKAECGVELGTARAGADARVAVIDVHDGFLHGYELKVVLRFG